MASQSQQGNGSRSASSVKDRGSSKVAWLAAPPPAPRLSEAEVEQEYPRRRLKVFLGIFIGYAGFYLIRNNIALVAPLLLDGGQITTVGIGIIGNAVLLAYGFSKFFSATISDRSNARYFLPLGLALSALANFVVAFVPAVGGSVALFATVMFVNGWVQGMGWPPCGRVLVHWFSTNERGWKTAIWNTAHNVGGIGVGALAGLGLSLTGNAWQSVFWVPAIGALVVAVIAFILIRDRPEAIGLPPIEEYRNDPAKVEADSSEFEEMSYWRIIAKHVLLNKTMVFLALANVFIYSLRYGVLTWAPTYLSEHHNMSLAQGIAGFSLFELAGIIGTLACGWVSDKFFRGNRSWTGIAFMVGVGVFLVAYWLAPVGTPYWLLMVFLFFIGAFIYGPVMLIGLQALDMSDRRVAGTAAGFTGLFGYVFGATLASSGIGWVVYHYSWSAAYGFLTLSVILTIALLLLVLPREKRLMNRHNSLVQDKSDDAR